MTDMRKMKEMVLVSIHRYGNTCVAGQCRNCRAEFGQRRQLYRRSKTNIANE
jgi:hypothetical protein